MGKCCEGIERKSSSPGDSQNSWPPPSAPQDRQEGKELGAGRRAGRGQTQVSPPRAGSCLSVGVLMSILTWLLRNGLELLRVQLGRSRDASSICIHRAKP